MNWTCPKCNAENNQEVLNCGCGYVKEPTSLATTSKGLSVGDWIFCLLLPFFGVFIGLLRFLRGKPNGGKMIGLSVAAFVLYGLIKVILINMH